ncbi:MAG: JAB domain-containing protein [Candidatus Theseobacter exili]|nr:JAB domain-containing protein [Candidatus Theseobacter exili]
MPTLVREIILKYRMRKVTEAEIDNGYLSKLSRPEDAVKALQDIADEGVERFVCLYLNSKNKVLVKQRIEDGTINMANPILREIFRYALACEAASIICCHNHPSGDPIPSNKDKTFTTTLVKAGDVLNIKVLDHVIIARDLETGEIKHFSFADHSLI